MKTMRNSVMLIGRPGNDPEMRITNNEKKMARFRLAVTEAHLDAEKKRNYTTEWFNVVAWGRQAELAEDLIGKGKKVMIHGTLHNNEWTNENGDRKTTTEILVDSFMLINEKKAS